MNPDRLYIQCKPLDTLTTAERDDWSRLLSESATSRWAFLSPTYAEAVNVAIGPADVVLCWRGNELAGVMPLQRAVGWLGRLGMWGPVGRQMTDYFGVLAQPGVKLEWRQLLRAAGVPCLYFTHLDESQVAYGLTGNSPRKGLRTRIHSDGGAAYWEWLRTQDKKLVSDTERRERKLTSEHGPLQFEMDSTTATQDLALLINLKNAQYLRTGHDGGALLNPANARLLACLLESRSPDCRPRLSVLRCDGQLVAAHFGLQCGALLHYWFPVYDNQFSAYSPGRVLYRHILMAAQSNGIGSIDHGEGESAAKRDFATEEHQFFKGLVSSGFRGRAVTLAQRLHWRLAALSGS